MDITLIVATHERHDSLQRMIQSFRLYYPQIEIVAVDSSKEAHTIPDITYIHTAPDTGISKQRNIALEQVKTPYVLLVDDDNICTEKTDLLGLRTILQEKGLGIVGGGIRNIGTEDYDFHGYYEIRDNVLYHFVGKSSQDKGYKLYDVIFNVFLAKTDTVRSIGGRDNKLKYAREHDDFFLQAKERNIRIGYESAHRVDHVHGEKYHGGPKSIPCIEHFCAKRNIVDKVEIRHIVKPDREYISYNHCLQQNTDQTIPEHIQKEIESQYGVYPIICS